MKRSIITTIAIMITFVAGAYGQANNEPVKAPGESTAQVGIEKNTPVNSIRVMGTPVIYTPIDSAQLQSVPQTGFYFLQEFYPEIQEDQTSAYPVVK